jgi:hypothetical protein
VGGGDLTVAAGSQTRVRSAAAARPSAIRPSATPPPAAAPSTEVGQLSQLGPFGLVRRPVVAAQSLSRLGNGEHVLIVTSPRRRLVTLGLTVPARIPRLPTRPPGTRQAVSAGVDPAAANAMQKGGAR